MLKLLLLAMSLLGCGWATCTEGQNLGEPDRWAVQEFYPASSPKSSSNLLVAWLSFPHTRCPCGTWRGEYGSVYKRSVSLCPPWTCPALWVTMRDKGTGPRLVLKQNHVPVSRKGACGLLQSPDALTSLLFYDPRQWAWYVWPFISPSVNSWP